MYKEETLALALGTTVEKVQEQAVMALISDLIIKLERIGELDCPAYNKATEIFDVLNNAICEDVMDLAIEDFYDEHESFINHVLAR